MNVRIGMGYDIHRLVPNRKLVLGGVEIPFERGLDGHSDADVVLHAICDAILGAVGGGDIGERFPNTDPQYKGISSMKLLKRVAAAAQEADYAVGNVDVVILAEKPNLKAYKAKMRFNIAYELAVDEDDVNIKATTNEGLGAVGAGEGIAAYAVVVLEKKKR